MSRPRSIGLVERRAVKARLSMFLAVACMVAGPLTTAATSSAAPLAPKLTHTDPASLKTAPALSTMPRIFGEGEPEEGGITRVLGSSRLFGPVIRGATQNPTFQIQIFASSNCQGAVLQTGTAGELEGAGILVTVGENALRPSRLARSIQTNPVSLRIAPTTSRTGRGLSRMKNRARHRSKNRRGHPLTAVERPRRVGAVAPPRLPPPAGRQCRAALRSAAPKP